MIRFCDQSCYWVSHLTTSRPTFLTYEVELDHSLSSSLRKEVGVYESSEMTYNILYVHMCIFLGKEAAGIKWQELPN